jgi:hypothetical protein
MAPHAQFTRIIESSAPPLVEGLLWQARPNRLTPAPGPGVLAFQMLNMAIRAQEDGYNPSFQLDFSRRQMNESLFQAGMVKAGSRMRGCVVASPRSSVLIPGAMTARACHWPRCAPRSRTIS